MSILFLLWNQESAHIFKVIFFDHVKVRALFVIHWHYLLLSLVDPRVVFKQVIKLLLESDPDRNNFF
jgi:hypothetical protein